MKTLALTAAGAAALLCAAPPAGAAATRVHAAFAQHSYRPGQVAVLHVVGSPSRTLLLDVLPAAALRDRSLTSARMRPTSRVTLRGPGPWSVYVRLGRWPSGVYLARLTTTAGRGIGYAPLILRPFVLGVHRTLVVEPTNTWQAYNTWAGDSWYLSSDVWKIDLTRPYAGDGLPPHFEGYDLGFLRWVADNGAAADFVSDDDLGRFESGKQLRRLYDLIVFPGHEEYVTGHVFDLVTSFRNRGGSLAFLSANSFFWAVQRHGRFMTGRTRWDTLGKQDAALVGAEYDGWESHLFGNHPYVVVGATKLPWLFAGTGLADGEAFGDYGIEIDQRNRYSPRNVVVAARISNDFGRGHSAEMTYYRRGRAQVFAAGVMNFGGSLASWPAAAQMMRNIWNRLGGDWLPPPQRARPSGLAGSGGEGHLAGPAAAAVRRGLDDGDRPLD